jgi:hypothetical protein
MQRLISTTALHGTLGSYCPDDALQEGSADAVACLPVPRALVLFPGGLLGPCSCSLVVAWWSPCTFLLGGYLFGVSLMVVSTAFSCKNILIY